MPAAVGGLLRSGPQPMANFFVPPRRQGTFRAQSSTAYLGGFAITGIAWLTSGSILVKFTTTYTGRHHQLYAGRTLIGQTANTTDLSLTATFQASKYPQYLQLVSVQESERFTDYGSTLPDRPYNVVRLTWETAASSDTRWLEVNSGAAPGDAADDANILERILFDQDRKYTYTTKPLNGSGTWNFEVAGRDDKPLDGNRGDPLAFQATGVLACPPDLVSYPDGSRLSYSIDTDADEITISYQLPEW